MGWLLFQSFYYLTFKYMHVGANYKSLPLNCGEEMWSIINIYISHLYAATRLPAGFILIVSTIFC